MDSDLTHTVSFVPDLQVHTDQPAHSFAQPPRVCPRDPHGPRIHDLIAQFVRQADAASHVEWLVKLRVICESHGCQEPDCPSVFSPCLTNPNPNSNPVPNPNPDSTPNLNVNHSSNFHPGRTAALSTHAAAHGAHTLHAFIRPFLTQVVPSTGLVVYDSEWGRAVDAMKEFHAFCVDADHVSADSDIDDILRKLKRFRPIGVPRNIIRLAQERWWNAVEADAIRIRCRMRARPDGGGGGGVVFDSSSSNGLIQAGRTITPMPSTLATSTATSQLQPQLTPAQAALFESGYTRVDSCTDEHSQFIALDIRRDGWVLQKMEVRFGRFCGAEPLFLPLPQHVAKMGVKGMAISCMNIGLRNGVWRPLEREGVFIGKAFPPLS